MSPIVLEKVDAGLSFQVVGVVGRECINFFWQRCIRLTFPVRALVITRSGLDDCGAPARSEFNMHLCLEMNTYANTLVSDCFSGNITP